MEAPEIASATGDIDDPELSAAVTVAASQIATRHQPVITIPALEPRGVVGDVLLTGVDTHRIVSVGGWLSGQSDDDCAQSI
ncbi:hypothetical protein [Mycobacterium sp. SMC-11]|uniref:hypothetical protein n=1 Tax=Mycobacterium sp. SMC-11 TaxID=3385969 RepID=UPI00390C799D